MTQITSPVRQHNVVKLRHHFHHQAASVGEQDPFSLCAFLNVLAFVAIIAVVNECFFMGANHTASEFVSCAHLGSSTPKVETIAIAPTNVREYGNAHESRYRTLQHQFASYLAGGNSVLHDYNFVAYLAETYGDCRPILQVGTPNPAMTLALGGARSVQVYGSNMLAGSNWAGGLTAPGFRGRNAKWTRKLLLHQLDVTSVAVSETDSIDTFRNHMLTTWMIVVSGVQREWLERLQGTHGFTGIVVIDQIHEGDDMRNWWAELVNAKSDVYQAYDVTSIAHAAGTGILDFSHTVHLLKGGEDQQLALIATS